jgi:hypothetical protein
MVTADFVLRKMPNCILAEGIQLVVLCRKIMVQVLRTDSSVVTFCFRFA